MNAQIKPFFSKTTKAADQERELLVCNCIRFIQVSGGVTIQFGDGSEIPVQTGDIFKAEYGVFDKVTLRGAGEATVSNGFGSLNGVSTVGLSGFVQNAGAGDPEITGLLNAADGQLAYDPGTGALYINPNTSGLTGWVALIL